MKHTAKKKKNKKGVHFEPKLKFDSLEPDGAFVKAMMMMVIRQKEDICALFFAVNMELARYDMKRGIEYSRWNRGRGFCREMEEEDRKGGRGSFMIGGGFTAENALEGFMRPMKSAHFRFAKRQNEVSKGKYLALGQKLGF